MGHFAQIGPFTAYQWEVRSANIRQRKGKWGSVCHSKSVIPLIRRSNPKIEGAQIPIGRLWRFKNCRIELSKSFARLGNAI